jgi:hypothetical protein
MKPALKRLLWLLAILCAWLAVPRGVKKQSVRRVESPPQSAPTHRDSPPIPKLLPARPATAENSVQSWERLLAVDGTPSEDRAALADTVTNYLQSSARDPRPPLGTNEEITRALCDPATLGEAAIPASHPAIVSGRLVDRWGSPWFFHQLSADLIEVRSAGPDRRLFTADDVAK